VILARFGATTYPWPWQDLHTRHWGLDVAAQADRPFAVAIADGRIVRVHSSTSSGGTQWSVWIFHPSIGKTFEYYHLATPTVSEGDLVRRGQRISAIYMPVNQPWVGHVHLMMCTNDCWDGFFQDPLPYLSECISTARGDGAVFPVEC
jgi:hypothetical protein